MSDIDVLVVGTGTAGQTAAYDLIAEGYEVAILEKSAKPGGVCALYGCQAKKYFYELTELAAKSRHLLGKGVERLPDLSWSQIRTSKNDFTSKIPESTILNLKGNGIEYITGDARFIDAKTVMAGGKKLSPRFIILATGAQPMTLPFKGADLLATSTDFLELAAMPERVVLVGGGFISFEFAHFAARLGAQEVVIVEAMERVLGPFDNSMVDQLVKASEAENIKIMTKASIISVRKNGEGLSVELASGEVLETDLVVHGAGRTPDIEGLNLDAAGINYSRRGIEVDEMMRTSNQKVYAVGDCAASVQLARVADQEAHVAASSIASRETGEASATINYEAAPAVLFTYPQLGMVGRTEEELKAEGIKYWTSSDTDLSWPNYRRIGMAHAAYKILVDNDSRILGAHFISDNATGLVNTFKQAILDGMTVQELYQANIMAPYPSRESDIISMLEPLLE